MTHGVQQYRKKLKSALRCGYTIRRRLLERWDSSLTGFLEEYPVPTFEEIAAAFGPPEEMAQILMLELTPDDTHRYRFQTHIKRILTIVVAAVFLILTLFIFFFKEFGNITIIDETHTSATYNVTEGE